MRLFRDRTEAGRRLAEALAGYADRSDVVVIGLPRGGVPVAFEVATALGVPLDVLVVRKLGVPGHEELAMGALASGGARVVDREIVALTGVTQDALDRVIGREQTELDRRERLFRGDRRGTPVEDRTVIIVDDGLATGSTMLAAVLALRTRNPARLVIAVPVASADTCRALRTHVDDLVCLETPSPFYAVGLWYEDFAQTTDAEVRELLDRRARDVAPATASAPA